MSEKIVGYLLISFGVMAIIYAVLNIFSVFSGKTKPVQIFNFSGISFDASQLLPQDLPSEASQLVRPESTQKAEIIPANIINDSSNIFAHLLLMGFLASAGSKVALIGAMLVRPINVKLRSKEPEKENS